MTNKVYDISPMISFARHIPSPFSFFNQDKNIEKQSIEIPLLENDTEDIIEYNVSNLDKKKIKKRYFWELLKKD